MKENDGKGARRKLWRQIGVVLGVFAIILVGLTLSGHGGGDASSSESNRNLQNVRDSARDKVAKMLGDKGHKNYGDAFEETKQKLKRHHMENTQFERVPKHVALERILNAEIHLVDLEVMEDELAESPSDSYEGVYGVFCELDFSIHKRDPSSVPMFRDLVTHSEECDIHKFRFKLSDIARMARKHDEKIQQQNDGSPAAVPKALNISAVVFHESRCGSTLVANALIGMNPEKHRTYSESTPPAIAIKICGENFSLCGKGTAASVLRDVMYLMSRSNDPEEERVFFKMQSITTRSLPTFLKAFPDVPWLFVFRDPVQVMMSHIKDGLHHANCVRPKIRPPPIVQKIVRDKGITKPANQIDDEYYCAAHLASLTESAVAAMTKSRHGIPVLYDSLPERLYQDILPEIFGRELTLEEIDNMMEVSQKYAKGRGSRARTFTGDSEQKEEAASDTVRHAADLFLKDSFRSLSMYAKSMPAD